MTNEYPLEFKHEDGVIKISCNKGFIGRLVLGADNQPWLIGVYHNFSLEHLKQLIKEMEKIK